MSQSIYDEVLDILLDSYPNMNNFRSNAYDREGYVVTCDDMIIDSRNIKSAYPEIKENKK